MRGRSTSGQRENTARDPARTEPPRTRATWSRSYQQARTTVLHLRDSTREHMDLASTVALVAVATILLLGTVTNTRVTSIPSPEIEIRKLGDPTLARERIVEENFTTVEHLETLANDPDSSELARMLYTHTPLILRYGHEFSERHNTPIGLYYTISQSTAGDATATTIHYFLWFVDEAGGMPIERRIATFGHSLDRELVYRVTLLGDRIIGAYYQAPGHRHVRIDYDGTSRPVFAVASGNNNFRTVSERELLHPAPKFLLVPLPHLESPWQPAHDPDFMALAVQEIWEKYHINMQDFVFVELELPPEPTQVTVSLRIEKRWYYLHEQIGGGVVRPRYNQVGVEIGHPVLPADISELRIVSFSDDIVKINPIRLSIYPRSDVPA